MRSARIAKNSRLSFDVKNSNWARSKSGLTLDGRNDRTIGFDNVSYEIETVLVSKSTFKQTRFSYIASNSGHHARFGEGSELSIFLAILLKYLVTNLCTRF